MPSVFHILNPSGTRRGWVRDVFARQRPTGEWAWVAKDHPYHTETLLDWALREEVDHLVVWGGDGSFHRVAAGLRARGALKRVTVSLVPAGTCNDLARRFGLRASAWREALPGFKGGRWASLALGRMRWESGSEGESVFLNNAGFGRSRRSFEKRTTPWGVLKSFRPLSVRAVWQGGELRGRYFMVLACNAPYFSGGLHFEADVSPEDPRFFAYFVPARSKVRLAARLFAGRLGFPLRDTKVSRVVADRIRMEIGEPVFPQADGEPPPETGVQKIEFEILPEKLKMWVSGDGANDTHSEKEGLNRS